VQAARCWRAGLQHIEHALQQYIGGGHQCVGQAPQVGQQLAHQAAPALAAEGFALVLAGPSVEALQGLVETTCASAADAQLRACANQCDMRRGAVEQAAGQVQAGMLVVADHRAELRRVQAAVDTDDRQAVGLQRAVAVVVFGQATGDEQGVAAPCAKQLLQLALAVGLVVAAGNQQLVALGPCALLQLLGDARIAGVFQVWQDEAKGARVTAAQPGRLR
uniref:ATP-dependent DNA helicase n=1 Tax=Steinernema glaseri TaxID=37863 RepID=A0A1I8AMG5_9BILA